MQLWRGPEAETSRLAMQYLRALDGDTFLRDYSHYVEFGGPSSYGESKARVLDVLRNHPCEKNLINACAKLLLHPWFSKLWCPQQGAVSTTTIVILWLRPYPWFNVFALAWLFLPHGADLLAVPAFHEAIDNLDAFREKHFCITKQGYLCLIPAVIAHGRSGDHQRHGSANAASTS